MPNLCPDCGRTITLHPTGWWSHDGLPDGCWRLSMDGPNRSVPSDRDIFLGDVIVCIAEDFGYNSWRQVSAYHWSDENPLDNRVTIHDLDEGKQYPVTVDTIRKGLKLIDTGQVGVNSTICQTVRAAIRNNDAGDIDAEIADIILQAGIFEDYIYG